MHHRWPKSLHSQVEAVFHSIRSIHRSKSEISDGIRSFGTWQVYRCEIHRLVEAISGQVDSLLNTRSVANAAENYLESRFGEYVLNGQSRQTMETFLSSLGKFEFALNHYINFHGLGVPPLDIECLRKRYYRLSRKKLPRSSRKFLNRAYPDPLRLIESIQDATCQLQASLQYEGGLRAEGVGAPSNNRLRNPLVEESLVGIGNDPVTGLEVGIISVKEKGGKRTDHYVSVSTYRKLEQYLVLNGQLSCSYSVYLESLNMAARMTDQYSEGRGTHGLKHNFSQERYLECVTHGLTHEQALQQTSLETAHFRLRETLTYTRGANG